MGDETATALHTLLERERRRRGWTLNRMAHECGMASSTLTTIYSRPDYVPRVATLRKLAKGTDLPYIQLATAAGLSVEEVIRVDQGAESDLIFLVTGWVRLGPAQRTELVALCRTMLGDQAPPAL